MNFLAHIALSGPSPEVIIGNFSGDYVKGKLDSEQKRTLPVNFLTGVRLHRFIDDFTDTDPIVKNMVKEVYPFYGRAASVATDISLDHFLSVHFYRFHRRELREFTSSFYATYNEFSYLIPDQMRPLAGALISNDWLYRYREWVTVERTFLSMGKRYPFLSDLSENPEILREHLPIFEQYFMEFYPRLQAATARRLNELQNTVRG